MSVEYLRVNLEEVKALGPEEALLLAYLSFRERKTEKDVAGFIALDAKVIMNDMAINKSKYLRLRKRLSSKQKIDVLVGTNQNQKPKIKLL